jgi:uncharacterized protein YcbK (DUF882 family)
VRSRSATGLFCALAATAASIFLSACSTSDGQGAFSLANPTLNAAEGTAATASNGADATAGAATETGSEDGVLPDQVAYLPAAKPATAFPEAGVAATAEADDKPVPPVAGSETGQAAQPASDGTQQTDQKPGGKEQVLTAAPGKPEQVMTATDPAAAQPAPKKRGFLASLFSASQASAAPAPQSARAAAAIEPMAKSAAPKADAATKAEDAAKVEDDPEAKETASTEKRQPARLIKLASVESTDQLAISRSSTGGYGSDALPGVRQTALFEIKRKSGIDDESDIDLNEDELGPIRVASAAGMARLAPNGLLKQRDNVDVACLKPNLVRMIRTIEGRFGRKAVITSGYRSPSYNRKVNGAERSQHMYCAAVDMQVPGVSKWDLATFVRSLPGRGGVGTYCHTESVHVDIGPERDWNWRCRRRKA